MFIRIISAISETALHLAFCLELFLHFLASKAAAAAAALVQKGAARLARR